MVCCHFQGPFYFPQLLYRKGNMFLILDAIAPREKPIGLGGDSNAAAGAQPGEGDPSYGQQLPPPGHPSHESDPP